MSSVRLAALVALVGCASLWSAAAHAQVFRIVGPDGRVTFTDRPPADTKTTQAAAVSPGGAASPGAGLPAELRTASSRFPVTLYTGVDCQPCMSARGYLASRGIPYSEKTVTSPDDIQALQRLMGEARLPFATIGGQHVRGFSEPEWSQYLDAAGYPKVSQLPPSFRNPPPTPMVAVQARPPATAQAEQPAQSPRAEAPTPSTPSPSNPLGLRF
jgi:glutaredoxin